MEPITKCPKCASDLIILVDYEVEPGYCTREMECTICGCGWVETFSPTSYIVLE